MKHNSDIKRFIETMLDTSVPADQQSLICSTELSLIGGDNGTCENRSDACGSTNNTICYNYGSFCNLSNNPKKCVNKEILPPPTNSTTCPPIRDDS